MSFNYLKNENLQTARFNYLKVLKENSFKAETEIIDVIDSNNRIVSCAVYAHINAPHYPSSAMDGIALQASITFGASETTPVIISKNDYVQVDTGDQVPENCDAVIMIEDVIFLDNGDVKLYAPATPWGHVRQIGEDICANEMIIPSGHKITPSTIGSLLAGGVLKIEVYKKPIIGIIPTGDEIVLPSENPKAGDIIEFNSSIFKAMLQNYDCIVKTYDIVKDKFDLIVSSLENALQECDVVIINAGSSAGRDDYSCKAIETIGNVLYHGIAIKPGKPTILGYKDNKAIIGVPGYPVSGILVIEELVKSVIDLWYNHTSAKQYATATLSKSLVSSLKYEEFVRVRLGYVNGKLVASPLNRGAGVVSSFMKADGILTIPQNLEGYDAGSSVKVELLKPLQDLENTIVVIGSHDPLIDELTDIINKYDPSLSISSSHTGSMGGIMAAKRGESHLGGIHLLSEKDGTYNDEFIKKYFPEGGVKLIECVNRVQGIMVAKGNPKSIKEFKDLANSNISFVNRQKGSGTRILTDYLLKKNNINPDNLYGYQREEFTHNAVATQIASNCADAGMGIYSAAKIYDLDFIPICNEQYDLIIPSYAYDLPSIQLLLKVLKSDEFKKRLEALGGYIVDKPGSIRKEY